MLAGAAVGRVLSKRNQYLHMFEASEAQVASVQKASVQKASEALVALSDAREAAESSVVVEQVRAFVAEKGLILYGGAALNAQVDAPFYDYTKKLADYDFYSPNALRDAVELARRLYRVFGARDTQVKRAVHDGTYKVYVRGVGVADVTQVPRYLFDKLASSAFIGEMGEKYASLDFLRIDLHKQLSETKGDASRLEKVYKRLALVRDTAGAGAWQASRRARPFTQEQLDARNAAVRLASTNGREDVMLIGAYAANLRSGLGAEGAAILWCADADVCAERLRGVARIEEETLAGDLGEMGFARMLRVVVGGRVVARLLQADKCMAYTELNGLRVGTSHSILFLLYTMYFAYGGRRSVLTAPLLALLEAQEGEQLDACEEGACAFGTRCVGPSQSRAQMSMARTEQEVERWLAKTAGQAHDQTFTKYLVAEDPLVSSEARAAVARGLRPASTGATGTESALLLR